MPLFDKDELINDADKPKLQKVAAEIVHAIPPNSKNLLDGGLLLHEYHRRLVTYLLRYVKHIQHT